MLLQFFVHVFGYDIWFYVSHRALHTRLLWPIHRIHHERVEPVWTDTYHGHWVETALQGLGFFAPWFLWQASSIYWSVALLALFFVNVRGMLHHDRRLTWLVGDYHVIHHRRPTGNFGQPWLDWLGDTTCQGGTGGQAVSPS